IKYHLDGIIVQSTIIILENIKFGGVNYTKMEKIVTMQIVLVVATVKWWKLHSAFFHGEFEEVSRSNLITWWDFPLPKEVNLDIINEVGLLGKKCMIPLKHNQNLKLSYNDHVLF
ncbi:hypothetical protein CR513_53947, partial [Mucuna pruriens]